MSCLTFYKYDYFICKFIKNLSKLNIISQEYKNSLVAEIHFPLTSDRNVPDAGSKKTAPVRVHYEISVFIGIVFTNWYTFGDDF